MPREWCTKYGQCLEKIKISRNFFWTLAIACRLKAEDGLHAIAENSNFDRTRNWYGGKNIFFKERKHCFLKVFYIPDNNLCVLGIRLQYRPTARFHIFAHAITLDRALSSVIFTNGPKSPSVKIGWIISIQCLCRVSIEFISLLLHGNLFENKMRYDVSAV